MDSNFIDYLAYAREKNLHAGIGFSTNASLLNREKGKEIIKYIDVIHISFPSLDEDEYEKITGLNFNVSFSNIDYFLSLTKKSSRKIKVRLIFVKPFNFYKNLRNYVEAERIKNFCNKRNIACLRWLFFNRAGNLSNYKNYFQVVTRRTKLNGCSLPTKHSPLRLMPILFNGDVLLCCMDWRREIVVGNLNTQNIAEIWNSKLYKGILDKIYFGKKSNNNFLCTRCINDCKFSYFFNVSIGCIYLLFRKLFLSIGRMLKYQKS
ncbi:MAG: hypothetical protein AMJ95_01110 [Omnitrophica WOR_2 bacterium SM23_72]|nr:MAG: hypothetical protein AMJ95_01110 [Omnitrophica WOR_2 bacterium SM23_72]